MSYGTLKFSSPTGSGGGGLTIDIGTTEITNGFLNSILFQNSVTDTLDQASTFVFLNNGAGVGRLGIGTISPISNLQVVGTSTLQAIFSQTNNTYDIGTSALYFSIGFINQVQTSNIRNISNAAGVSFQSAGASSQMCFFPNSQNIQISNSSPFDSSIRFDVFSSSATSRFTGKTNIGTSPTSASAILEISTTLQGFLLPKLTTTQEIFTTENATLGLQIWNTTINDLSYRIAGTRINIDIPVFNAPNYNRQKRGTVKYVAPTNYQGLKAGLSQTILYSTAPFELRNFGGNFFTLNAIFSATRGVTNTLFRIYLSVQQNSLAGGFIEIGRYRFMAADFAAGNTTVGYTKNWFIQYDPADPTTPYVFYDNLFSANTNNNFQLSDLTQGAIGFSNTIFNRYLIITADNEGVLLSAQVTFAK